MQLELLKTTRKVKPRQKNLQTMLLFFYISIIALTVVGFATSSPDAMFQGRIQGVIYNFQGTSPVSNLRVTCYPYMSNKYFSVETTTDSQGRFNFENIPYGRYIISASYKEGYGICLPVELKTSRIEKNCRVESMGSIYGDIIIENNLNTGKTHVREGVGNPGNYVSILLNNQSEIVNLVKEISLEGNTETGYYFPNIPPGRHGLIVNIQGIGIKKVPVEIKAGKITRVAVRMEGKISPIAGRIPVNNHFFLNLTP
ncbi:MAG: hypothetical protein ACLFQV_01995 [Vulcanimicrobiota bacterium]